MPISRRPSKSGKLVRSSKNAAKAASTLLIASLAFAAEVEITPITHASVQLSHEGKVVQVDPTAPGAPADLILITGAENDHLDPAAIAKIRKPGAPVVIPAAGKDKVPDGIVLNNGESREVAGVQVEAIAAYDLIPGEPFHPKGRGNGYVIAFGGKRIYFSGVTECVPEVQALRGIDIAFVSMNLPHERMTMTAAAACVAGFGPKVVYPYHYRNAKLEEFKAALAGKPIEVRFAEWYPRK